MKSTMLLALPAICIYFASLSDTANAQRRMAPPVILDDQPAPPRGSREGRTYDPNPTSTLVDVRGVWGCIGGMCTNDRIILVGQQPTQLQAEYLDSFSGMIGRGVANVIGRTFRLTLLTPAGPM